MIPGITRGLRRRTAPVAALAVAGLLAISACGSDSTSGSTASGASSNDPITISFLSYNYGTPGLGGEGIQNLLDAFKAANPTITVKAEGVAVKDVLTKLRADTAAGSPPDVAQIGWSKMASAYAALPIVPVQDLAPAAEWKSHTAGISQNLLAAVSDGGKVKAMPFTMSIPTLFYNADLFRKAGLDPDQPPTTIAQIKDAGLAIKKVGANGAYIAVVDSGKSDYLTQSLVTTNGGSLVGPSGSIALDQKPAVDALAAVADLTSSGAAPSVASDAALAAFNKGELGMIVGSTAVLASAQKAAAGKFELRTAGFPGIGTNPARPTYSGAGLAVLAKDKAHQDAAWKFIKFLSSEEGFTTIATKMGYLPLRDTVARKIADTPIGKLLAPPLAQLATVSPYTFFPGERASEAVVALQDNAVAPIVLQGADPQKTLSEVAGKIRSLK
ncbi:extracellular solute-binding protein [Candidatus Protofrankia californiensis]|uniref:extracellular solute-binding protein n=1 Tax=Candidatus Protofrankia californiensis TaxID=1839754 RepID=UPI0010415174|nr:extracellular solute-binding protein [Candidatus Protofrankia californiensis]